MNYYAFALRKRPQETVAVVQAGNFLVYTVSALTWLAAALLFVVPLPVAHISRIWFFALLAMGFTFIYGYGSRILNAMDEQSWLNRMNLAQPLLFLLLYIPLWLDRHLSEAAKLSWTYNLWIVSFAVAVGLTMIITYRHLRHAGILRWRVSLRELAGTLNYGGWSAAAQGTSNIARNVGYWCLASNKDILSVYGIALVMAEVLNNLSGSIIQLVFARMTGGSREDAIAVTQSSTRQTLLSSSLAAAVMMVTFPWLLVLAFGPKYYGAIVPFLILLPGYVLRAGGSVIMQYFTNSLGQPFRAVVMNVFYIGVNGLLIWALWHVCPPLVTVAVATTLSSLVSFITYVWWFRYSTGQPGHTVWLVRRSDFRPYLEVVRSLLTKVRGTRSRHD